MKKDKLYFIVSILFVAVVLIITIGFRKTYAAAPTGDLGGEGDLYWAIDGNLCDTADAGCTLKISNNPIGGTHYVNGKLDGTKIYYSYSIPWKGYLSSVNGINNVVIGGEGDIIKPTTTSYWFYNLQASSIDLTYLDTSEVTDMSYMFSGFGTNVGDVVIDLSGLNTSNVSNMSDIFSEFGKNASSVEVIGLDTWDTSKVTNISSMFYNFGLNSSTIDLNLSGWNLSKVTNMYALFSYIGKYSKNLTIDMSNWIFPASAAYDDSIFNNIGINAENVDLIMKNCDVSNKNSLSHFFSGLFAGSFSEKKDEFEANYTLDVTGWNTSNVEDMSYMFYNTTFYTYGTYGAYEYNNKLNLIGIDTWDTSNVTNMSYMFSKCNIVGLDLSNFNTSKVEDMSYMFEDFQRPSLDSLPKGINNFDTSNVTNMSWMFSNVYIDYSKELKLDLSNFDTSNVIESDYMFYDSVVGFSEIKVGNKWTLPLNENNWLNNETKILYVDGEIPQNVAGTYVISNIYWKVEDDTLIITSKYSNDVEDFYYDYDDYTAWNSPCSYHTKYFNKVRIGGEDDIIYPNSMHWWFSEDDNLEEIDLTYLDTRNVTDMSYAFATGSSNNHSALTKIIGLENLDTSNVENMEGIFAYNYSLEELDLTGFDTSNVTNMKSMFLTDTKLKIIKGLENLDVSNVVDFSDMFGYCSSLEKLDLSNWNTKKGTCDGNYFEDDGPSSAASSSRPNISVNKKVKSSRSECKIFDKNTSLNEIKIGNNFNIKLPNSTWINKNTNEIYSVEDIPVDVAATYIKDGLVYWIIDNNTLLLSGKYNEEYNILDTNNYILNQKNWLDYSDDIEEVVIENTIKPIIMNEWFKGLTKVKKLDLSNVDTSNLQSVYKLVNDMDNLEELNLTNLDLSNIKQCKYNYFENSNILERISDFFGCSWSPNPNITQKVESSHDCESYYYNCVFHDDYYCNLYNNNCSNYSLSEIDCSDALFACEEYENDLVCELYNNQCKTFEYNENTCSNILYNYYYDIDDGNIDKEFGNIPLYDNNCSSIKLDDAICANSLYYCEENNYDLDCELYEKYCSSFEYNKNSCENILYNYYYDDERDIGDFPLYDDNCKSIGNTGSTCLKNKFEYDKYESEYAREFLDTYCQNFEVTSDALNRYFYSCLAYTRYNDDCEIFDLYGDYFEYSESDNEELNISINEILKGDSDDENIFDLVRTNFKISDENTAILNEKIANCLNSEGCPYYLDIVKRIDFKYTDDNIENINDALDKCLYSNENYYCDLFNRFDNAISVSDSNCVDLIKLMNNYSSSSVQSIYKDKCLNITLNINSCEKVLDSCWDNNNYACKIYENKCKSLDISCDIFNNNDKLKQISVDENNADLVKESLSGPDNETGKWYDREGNPYDVSEILNEDKTYYSSKPSIVSYNVEVDDQAKLVGEDLTLYDEIIKDSETKEIITKFDTVGGNDIDDVTSLKITTYTLKDFTDGDGNIYLPGSKYTKDEDLELDVNYNSEDHYNEIELPIPVKHGYKFEYWTLDGERIDKYTPKTNETLVAVWTEIKYHFVDDEVEYEKENIDNVIFETVEGLDNFEELYINGKQLENGEDYTIDGNKIILTEKGKEYLDSLEPGEYEVRAEFSDSNSDVYGIIKVSEKEEPKVEPDNPEKDKPKDNPITPKTSDYILFTVIIALTALISSIFVYKKIEY